MNGQASPSAAAAAAATYAAMGHHLDPMGVESHHLNSMTGMHGECKKGEFSIPLLLFSLRST
jgi:hypothetical protein